jgi:phasin family protein
MAESPPDFTDMFRKLGEQLKVPPFDMGRMMEHHQKNLDAIARSWQAVAGGAQEIARKQQEIFETAVRDVTAMVQDYQPGGPPHEAMARHAEFVKKVIEAAISNTRDIAQLTQQSATDAMAIVQQRMTESFEEIRAAVEKK